MTQVTERFLRPRRIALIGSSRNPQSITARPAHYLRKWGTDARVVIVHPGEMDTLHGFPVVGSISEAGAVDTALVLVAADRLPSTLEECAAAGIRSVVSIASGFEGPEGEVLRERVEAVLRKSDDLRLLGPNCVGLVSPASGTVLSFSSVLLDERPSVGHAGLITQSGAIGNALMSTLIRRGVGLAHWFSTGDELDLGAIELADALVRDPTCRVVGLFLEGLRDAEFLPRVAEAIAETGTRVVAMRGTSSSAGRRAALGHTGRVVGDAEVAKAGLRDAGIELVESLEEFADALTILSVLPPAKTLGQDLQVGIVTVSGGVGVLAADAVAATPGVAMAEFGEPEHIASRVDIELRVRNPLDVAVLGQPQVFPGAIRAVASDPGVDAVVAVVSELAHDYDLVANADLTTETPVILTHLAPDERFSKAQNRRLTAKSVPSVGSAVTAVKVLGLWAGAADAPLADPSTESHDAAGETLPFSQAVAHYDLGDLIPPFQIVSDVQEVIAFAKTHGSVALKADGVAIQHRTDVGAVDVGLIAHDEIVAAWSRISAVCESFGDRPIVQAMASPGIEVMVTAVHDPEVGPAAILRAGGILTELVSETTILTGDPKGWANGERVIGGSLGKLLQGWRGRPGGDVPALIALARRVCDAVTPGTMLECNPVIVHPPGTGVAVVDILATRVSGS